MFLNTCAGVAGYAAGGDADPFGQDFSQTPPLAPPYRAVKVTGALLHTQGGAVVDMAGRVLRADAPRCPTSLLAAARRAASPGHPHGAICLSMGWVLGRPAGAAAAALVSR